MQDGFLIRPLDKLDGRNGIPSYENVKQVRVEGRRVLISDTIGLLLFLAAEGLAVGLVELCFEDEGEIWLSAVGRTANGKSRQLTAESLLRARFPRNFQ